MSIITTSIVSTPPSSNPNYRALRVTRSTSGSLGGHHLVSSKLKLINPQGSSHYLTSFTPCLLPRSRRYVIMAANNNVESTTPTPTGRKEWILGIVLTMFLPFFKGKWGPFLLFQDKFDTDLQKVEDTVEIIEKVAEGLDEAAEDLSAKLPDGTLKNAVIYIEHIVEEAAKDLKLADDAIDKFQEIEEEAKEFVKSRSKKPSEQEIVNNEQA